VSSLNAGQFVAAGTTIATLVESDGTWVEANFKETQLADLKVGQPAEVKVDAYGNKIGGTVESIGAATGSEFSLIPAQNATGNWVKVVQRVPVRIKLADASETLRTGMSATVTVDTGKSTLDKLTGK
jgi:membrane fusion protein (multidrug efflux system)